MNRTNTRKIEWYLIASAKLYIGSSSFVSSTAFIVDVRIGFAEINYAQLCGLKERNNVIRYDAGTRYLVRPDYVKSEMLQCWFQYELEEIISSFPSLTAGLANRRYHKACRLNHLSPPC